MAKLLAIQPSVVYHWKRRFDAAGLLGLTTRPRAGTPITTRVPVPVIMEVFQRLDNNPLRGHDRVKMALDALGYRDGHMTVWAMVALYKQAHLTPPRAKRPLNPDERPKQATTPHQVWFADIRYLVKLDGLWLYSVLIFDGYSRAIVGAGCFDRQNFAQLVQVFRQAMAQWGAPEAVVSDHGAVFVALQPCLAPLAIQWAPMTKGHPWQNLAEGGFSVQRRMLDASVTGCTDRETVYRQHAQFVQDYQFWGHWVHKRKDAQGRLYDVSPEVILANAWGREIEPARLRRVFRLRQLTRQVRQLENGYVQWEAFDQPLIATGASPFAPDVPGAAAQGIYGLSTLQSGLAVRRAIDEEQPQRAVIVGGGYIGLEMAEALVLRGLEVSLVEKMPQVMGCCCKKYR